MTFETIATLIADLSDNHALTTDYVASSNRILAEAGLTVEVVGTDHVAAARSILLKRSRDLSKRVARFNGTHAGNDQTTNDTTEFKPKRKKHTQKRHKIFGHSCTAVIRWMGANDFTFEDAGVALAYYGAGNVSDTTIRLQLKAGKDGDQKRGPAADLTKAEERQLIAATK